MLALMPEELSRTDSRFLEPACGSGHFLVPILERKLAGVASRYGGSNFERRHYSLVALMSVYGIEILGDNVADCRTSLAQAFAKSFHDEDHEIHAAANVVLKANIVHGDAVSMMTVGSEPVPIEFAEWAYVGKGAFQRRDFRLDTMTQMSSFGADTLLGGMESHELFVPVRSYQPQSIADLAALDGNAT